MDVSVVIAARNEQQHVAEAVTSVASQLGVAMELVFVDDNSTDRTYEIVESLTKQFPNIRLVKNAKSGKVSAFNYGVSLATGQWVCLFAGDDIMPEGSLALRWAAVKDIASEKPVVGLSRLMMMADNHRDHGVVVPKDPTKGGLTGTSFLMDRKAVEFMFPVPEELPNEDTWLDLAASHLDLEIVHSGVVGCHWRIHTGNSISHREGFSEFNRKITRRYEAIGLFKKAHAPALSSESSAYLARKMECERARRRGDLFGIVRSGVSAKEQLRAMSQANEMIYNLRARFYGFFSGL